MTNPKLTNELDLDVTFSIEFELESSILPIFTDPLASLALASGHLLTCTCPYLWHLKHSTSLKSSTLRIGFPGHFKPPVDNPAEIVPSPFFLKFETAIGVFFPVFGEIFLGLGLGLLS